MPRLYLKFNDSFEYVKLKLEGAGTLEFHENKAHIDILCHEIINFIKHERPATLEFDGKISLQLIGELSKVGITYDTISKKLTYSR